MLANETYQKLLKDWSKEEVELYLQYIAGDSAPEMISEINSETVVGLSCFDFHERYELTILETLVDNQLQQPGAYRQALQQGNLADYHEFKTGEIIVIYENITREKKFIPYFEAHPLALRAEMSFIREVAKQLGYDLSELALLIARPVNWEEMEPNSNETLEHFYQYERKHNLMIVEEDVEDQMFPPEIPNELVEEIILAEKFYIDHGATYPNIGPSQLLKKNGIR